MPINKVYLADCMDVMRMMPDKSVDLCIVDPPYGIGMDIKKVRTKPSRPSTYIDIKIPIKNNKWDNLPPNENYFQELYRISKNQIIFGANYFTRNINKSRGWIFWDKQTGENNSFSDGEFIYQSIEDRSRQIKMSQKIDTAGGRFNIHPTQKPVTLYKWLLQNYAKPNDKIFDSHVGSGSSRIACYDLGFDFEGCELDPDYWQGQEDRFNLHISQQSLFDTAEIQELIYHD